MQCNYGNLLKSTLDYPITVGHSIFLEPILMLIMQIQYGFY
jgi:hypothetical protein